MSDPAWMALATGLIDQFESCCLTAYPDPGTGAEPWTIGWGSTGPGIVQGTVWTQAQADADRDQHVLRLGAQIDGLVTVALTDDEKAALVSFCYNLGIGALTNSTLLRLLNAGNYTGAAAQFDLWDHAAGKVMAGLLRRRQAETDEFLSKATGVDS